MGKKYLEAGQVVGTHGVVGHVRVQSWCDSNEVLADFKVFYLDEKGGQRLQVSSARVHKNIVLVKLSGVNTIEQAEALRGRVLFIDRDDLELPEGTYFIQDLVGLDVFDADSGERYGVLSDVSFTGANDVYHVLGQQGREYLVPAVEEMIVSVDIDENKMEIRPIKGIFDDED